MLLMGSIMLMSMYDVIEGLASVTALCCVIVIELFGHTLRAHRDRRRFRITEVSLFTLTSTAMTFIAEVYLKRLEPDQSILSLLLYRQACVLAALITTFSGAQSTPNMGRWSGLGCS
jgi:hypothetical protein